jgi:hypothetical protein
MTDNIRNFERAEALIEGARLLLEPLMAHVNATKGQTDYRALEQYMDELSNLATDISVAMGHLRRRQMVEETLS